MQCQIRGTANNLGRTAAVQLPVCIAAAQRAKEVKASGAAVWLVPVNHALEVGAVWVTRVETHAQPVSTKALDAWKLLRRCLRSCN